MTANLAIGEAVCDIGQSSYMVRPTFAALATLGGPEDIDYVIRCCLRAVELWERGANPAVFDIAACSTMVEACSDIPTDLLGWAEPARNDRLLWRQRIVPINDLVVMANHCIKWGVMGDPRRKMNKRKREKAAGLFDPQEFVALLMEEFNVDRATAWGTTMTEFQRLCEARERKNWGDRPEPPTREEVEKSMKWAREVTQRAAKVGVKQERGKRRARG